MNEIIEVTLADIKAAVFFEEDAFFYICGIGSTAISAKAGALLWREVKSKKSLDRWGGVDDVGGVTVRQWTTVTYHYIDLRRSDYDWSPFLNSKGKERDLRRYDEKFGDFAELLLAFQTKPVDENYEEYSAADDDGGRAIEAEYYED